MEALQPTKQGQGVTVIVEIRESVLWLRFTLLLPVGGRSSITT